MAEYKKNIKNKLNLEEDDIIEITDLAGFGDVEIPFALDNAVFKKGIS